MLISAWKERRCATSLRRLVLSHARIAWAVAASYAPRNEAAQEDLAQSGMLGLMRAADMFKPSFGGRFAGYASLWVRSYIAQAAAGILLPVDMPSRKFVDARAGRLDEGDAARLLTRFGTLSLDMPVASGEGLTLADVLESQDPDPNENCEEADRQEVFRRYLGDAISELTPREQEIIRLRRLEHPHLTLAEVSSLFNVTRERVRQIEVAAMKKVRRQLEDKGFRLSDI